MPTGSQVAPALVEIGGERFTRADFLLHLRQVNPQIDFARLPPAEQRHWVDDFVARKLFALKARRAGLDRDAETRARLAFFADGVLAQAFRDKVLKDLTVSDEELEAYYRSHPAEFTLPARVLLQHVLYRTSEKATRAAARLREGEAFAALAQEKKVDADALLAERRWFPSEELVPELREVAFGLRAGDVGGPVRSSYGHHVVRVEAAEPARVKAFAAARAEVEEKARRAKAGDLYQKLLDEARREHGVRLYLGVQ